MKIDMLDTDGKVRCAGCTLEVGRYRSNGNIAMHAYAPDGELWGSVTVNDGVKRDDSAICVKDYSEGEGNLRSLLAAGLVEEPHAWSRSGHVDIPVCRLTEAGRKLVEEAT